MSAVIYLPDPLRLRAGMESVRHRAASINASADALRRALHILLHEMQAGRSSGAAVALANSSFRRAPLSFVDGGDAA